MKFLLQTLCVAVLSISFAVRAGDDIRWTEEVKLSDGRVVQIQRHVELTDSGFPLQRRGFTKYYEICYPPMDIHWKSKGGYQPDIFDIVDGKAYMHVPISDCFSCEHHGYPSTNALYFVWDNGTWKQIAHEDFPKGSEWNLLMQTNQGSKETDPQGLITIEDKTMGKQADSSLLREQQRLGWKRVSDSHSWKGRCDACRGVKNRIYGDSKDIFEIFVQGAAQFCQ